ncbi:5'-nucleotidase C-terminal domain-containing protein [Edaphocola flava]|uniref:5'-nucleotidase C-terminal domain-containing protein n=1 Tax=Edaphocola flava TaxID=2499629 RepID=UPI001386BC3B|nr:5'-nucleotidase [Edaphocola flava]
MRQKITRFLGLAGVALIAACSPKQQYLNTQHRAVNLTISDTIPADTGMVRFLSPYKQKMDSNMNQVIGYSDVSLTKALPECNMGNFAADAQLDAARKLQDGVEVSVVNYGGLRIPFIPKGAITKGRIYELMPFDNMVTILEVPGDILLQFCNHMAKRKGWPVSGMTYVIRNGQAEQVLVQGKSVNPHLVYKVAVSDYIANGGDDCDFLKSCKKYPSSVFLRDALMDKVRSGALRGNTIYQDLQNRVRNAE